MRVCQFQRAYQRAHNRNGNEKACVTCSHSVSSPYLLNELHRMLLWPCVDFSAPFLCHSVCLFAEKEMKNQQSRRKRDIFHDYVSHIVKILWPKWNAMQCFMGQSVSNIQKAIETHFGTHFSAAYCAFHLFVLQKSTVVLCWHKPMQGHWIVALTARLSHRQRFPFEPITLHKVSRCWHCHFEHFSLDASFKALLCFHIFTNDFLFLAIK